MIRHQHFIHLLIASISGTALLAMQHTLDLSKSVKEPVAEEVVVDDKTTLEDLFLPLAAQGTADDIQALLDQGLHPNNTPQVMPEFWQAIIKRNQDDKENALPIIRTLLTHGIKLLGSNTAPHNNTNKKVVINMDVNGTIVFGDTNGGRTPEQSAMLALVDDLKYTWDDTINEPISFSNYVDLKLPGSSIDEELRKKRDQEKFAFLTFLEQRDHPLRELANEMYHKMVKQLNSQKGMVFTSFYKLIEYLQSNNIIFSIVLRSFGTDTDNVAAEINKHLRTRFFKNPNDFRGLLRLIDALPSQERLAHLAQIYNFIKTTDHAAVRDDYCYWNSNLRQQQYGKLFPIDNDDSSVLQIFLDDNIASDPESSINIVNPIDIWTGKSLDIKELMQRHIIIHVNGVEALLDDDYFIKVFQAAFA